VNRRLDPLGWTLLLLGAGAVANAVWMLLSPGHWYEELPAGVPDTGPLNLHFVRDIGCAFLAVGVAQVWAAFDRRRRLPLAAIAALFLLLHAGLHVYDTTSGFLDAGHWWLDLPGVYLPAAAMVAAALASARQERLP